MSNYATMCEFNGRVNRSRQRNRLALPYLQAVAACDRATDEDKALAQQGADIITGYDQLLTKGYVSTGFQYDDQMCERVDAEDRYWDTIHERCGSTSADEAEAEIAYAIASERAKTSLDHIIEYFDEDKAIDLFDVGGEHSMSLDEWIEEGAMALRESWEDERFCEMAYGSD